MCQRFQRTLISTTSHRSCLARLCAMLGALSIEGYAIAASPRLIWQVHKFDCLFDYFYIKINTHKQFISCSVLLFIRFGYFALFSLGRGLVRPRAVCACAIN